MKDKSEYYFPHNKQYHKYQQFYSYKHQTEPQPEEESQFYEDYDNMNLSSNQFRDFNIKEFQQTSQVYDMDELNSQFVGKMKLSSTNSTNYPHYLFESSSSK